MDRYYLSDEITTWPVDAPSFDHALAKAFTAVADGRGRCIHLYEGRAEYSRWLASIEPQAGTDQWALTLSPRAQGYVRPPGDA